MVTGKKEKEEEEQLQMKEKGPETGNQGSSIMQAYMLVENK